MRSFVLAALLGMSLVALAQEPSSPAGETDAQRFVRTVRAIEARPLSDGKDLEAAWAVGWATKTPDYTVLVCPMGGEGWEMDDALGAPLLFMAMLGNMAWQIEQGDKAGDELSRQHAGALTALRIYERTIARNPSQRRAYFDDLVAKRDAGTLRGFLAPYVAKDCRNDRDSTVVSGDLPSDGRKEVPFLGGFLQATDVVYPTKVGAWEWMGEHRYDDPEAGVSARYARKGDDDNWIDVYFYPVGTLDEAEAARLAEMERDSLQEHAAAPGETVGSLSTFDIPLTSQAAVTGRYVDFVAERDGKRRNSSMGIGVHRLYAVKVRYSVDPAKETREQAKAVLQAFTRAMFARLEIDSTGGCREHEPRLEGCSAPKEELRAAPEGMRILRMEYAVPGEKSTPSAPLRAKRGGVG